MNEHNNTMENHSSNDLQTSLIRVDVHLPGNPYKTYEVECEPTITAAELLGALLKEMNLPKRDFAGALNSWVLIQRSAGVCLRAEQVIGELTPDSDLLVLYVEPLVCAG